MTRLLPTLILAFLLSLPPMYRGGQDRQTLAVTHQRIHARLKPNDSGQGGLPYVAAYVKQVRQIVVTCCCWSGGCVSQGRMASWITRGRVMNEAMNQIGYDAGVPGNHDFAYGADQLRAKMPRHPFLCSVPTRLCPKSKCKGRPSLMSMEFALV